jgi:hypothetical protein
VYCLKNNFWRYLLFFSTVTQNPLLFIISIYIETLAFLKIKSVDTDCDNRIITTLDWT